MGSSADRQFDENQIHLSLAPNPSHLEIVDPVVVGRVRAKQAQRTSDDFKEVLGVILHGDAAFAGQGVVAETFAFSALRQRQMCIRDRMIAVLRQLWIIITPILRKSLRLETHINQIRQIGWKASGLE